jgi:hypothetical protein
MRIEEVVCWLPIKALNDNRHNSLSTVETLAVCGSFNRCRMHSLEVETQYYNRKNKQDLFFVKPLLATMIASLSFLKHMVRMVVIVIVVMIHAAIIKKAACMVRQQIYDQLGEKNYNSNKM